MDFLKSLFVDANITSEIKKVIRLGNKIENCNQKQPALIIWDSPEK